MMMNLTCLKESRPNFLWLIYSYTECQPSPRRGHAPRKKPLPATALVFVWLLLTNLFYRGTDWFSGRDTSIYFCWSFNEWSLFTNFIVYRFLIQNLAQSPACRTFDKVLEIIFFCFRFLCSHLRYSILGISDIFQHLLRIVFYASLRDHINKPQYFTGKHKNWLHLFKRIVQSCRIILIQLFKFICMCHQIKQPETASISAVCVLYDLFLSVSFACKIRKLQVLLYLNKCV